MTTASLSSREIYQEQGFYLHPTPILPAPLIRQVRDRVPAVLGEAYDTGIQPWVRWQVGAPGRFQKIDQVHLCDKMFHFVSTHPIIGTWVAEITGADWVQVFATQLFLKPPGGGDLGVFNWHNERTYWQCWEGEVLAVWLALDDIEPDSGPVIYVEGSHRWPVDEKQGDAFTTDLHALESRLKARAPARQWRKVEALLQMGGAAFHSADTLHGSGTNKTAVLRAGLGISVRTNRARIKPGLSDFDYTSYLAHPFICPVIYQRGP